MALLLIFDFQIIIKRKIANSMVKRVSDFIFDLIEYATVMM